MVENKKFCESDLIKLIDLYEEHECLWNMEKDYLYKRIDLKVAALEKIGQEMKMSSEEVKRKIKSLRATYVGEKKKVDTKKIGAWNGGAYESKLFWYHKMKFLDNIIVYRRGGPNIHEVNTKIMKIPKYGCPPIQMFAINLFLFIAY